MCTTTSLSAGLLLGAGMFLACSAAASFAQDTPLVGVMTVALEDVSPSFEFVGRVEALNAVDIRARIEGFLADRLFSEGQTVEKDQDLFVVERTAYEIALTDARAALASAQAALDSAERQFQRNRSLSERTVSQAVLEDSETARDTARANLLSAQARVSQAELNLAYTNVKSPLRGRIGRAAFAVGSLVGPSSAPLARVVQTDPIRVVFSVSDRSILDLRAAAGASKDELAKGFVPRLRLSNGEPYTERGEIEFFENEVDVQTGTLAIRALFANPRSILMSGQFVTVVVRRAEPELRPVAPVGSVGQDRDGRFVLLVDEQNRASLQRIRVSRQVGDNWVVEEGLKGGEKLIVQGIQRVSPGALVKTENISPDEAAPAAASTSMPGGSSQ
ncbi:efflux RND transporter periplasmic adaptor subunit [Ensifer aridi]|uniref:efflux RND transporter periplasmic adaptor subunit n=1 Tax=Ensifer aridi TaxID=1708715 RepID=UPI00358F38BC